jgi:hypothetical protein
MAHEIRRRYTDNARHVAGVVLVVRHRFANVLDEKRRLTDAERELRLALSVLTKLLLQIVQERGDMPKFRRDLANTSV